MQITDSVNAEFNCAVLRRIRQHVSPYIPLLPREITRNHFGIDFISILNLQIAVSYETFSVWGSTGSTIVLIDNLRSDCTASLVRPSVVVSFVLLFFGDGIQPSKNGVPALRALHADSLKKSAKAPLTLL